MTTIQSERVQTLTGTSEVGHRSVELPVLNSQVVASRGRVELDGKLFRQGGARLRVCGVTYGTFAPNGAGEPWPEPAVVARDFEQMRAGAINAVRIYSPPPVWLLDLAEEHGQLVLVETPCPKHLDFLESAGAARDARQQIKEAVKSMRGRDCLLGCCIGNEIPSDLVRWYGARRIEKFLAELADLARQTDPEVLVTYANYPPTEYLDLPFLDFTTFNVYLHNPATFRKYLLRLANLACDRPLVLGEIGMDTLRHGEAEQAEFLSGHAAEAALVGLAGAFVFSWTDDWFTRGYQIDDWAFGITRRDRTPKAAYRAVADVFGRSPSKQLKSTPRVSVIVCSYNGGRTLDQCLRSLGELDYPDLEVILVDDSSTDNTPAIAARFPNVRTIRQENQGLSVARNTGLGAAAGEIVAFTDSDCFADPDWLTLLVHQLETSGATAVGGPNLTPEDGWLAGCVACAPGQPIHVLESDEDAEHIPGCNMAFRRDALLAIGAFDPIFRKAGDDVDVCWRLQEAGYRITFAPGAFVWHHRRQGLRTYLRQQSGYGEAEALLATRHPERFSILGGAIWRGVMYGAGLTGLRVGGAHVHGGVFGQGLFQTLYRPAPAHWAMLPSTLEWQTLAVLLAVGRLAGLPTLDETLPMLALTFIVTVLQTVQARPAKEHDGFAARCVIGVLCWLQPLVRSGQRYRTRFGAHAAEPPANGKTLPWEGPVARFITMEGINRAVLLQRAADELRRKGHHPHLDTGWSHWDIEVPCTYGVQLRVRTVQEFYGGNSAQIAIELQLRRGPSLTAVLGLGAVAALAGFVAFFHKDVPAAVSWLALAGLLLAGCYSLWRRGRASALRAVAIIHESATALGMTPFHPEPQKSEETK